MGRKSTNSLLGDVDMKAMKTMGSQKYGYTGYPSRAVYMMLLVEACSRSDLAKLLTCGIPKTTVFMWASNRQTLKLDLRSYLYILLIIKY